jgi:hypothetical protein
MSHLCQWLHEQLEPLPLIKHPFNLNHLPTDGIYFFYETGETWSHGALFPRIVRVGSCRKGNFQNRISEHFLLNSSKMNYTVDQAAPHDRSIFRKNLGRALLNKANDPYLAVWNLDFTSAASRGTNKHLRDLIHEKKIEAEVTQLLREKFSFRFIKFDPNVPVMGSTGFESNLIGTLARCQQCHQSPGWLGNYSPETKHHESGLWLYQHLASPELDPGQQQSIQTAINTTRQWLTTLT